MKSLTIRDIEQSYNKKRLAKEDCFEKVLEECFRKIDRIVQKKYDLFLFYEVPQFLIGYPIYNVNECLLYIKAHIEKNGFLVKYFFPNILYISWNKDEIEKAKLQNEMQTNKQLTHLLTSSPQNTSVLAEKKTTKGAKQNNQKKKLVLNLI